MALSGTFSNAYKGYTYQISWSATQNVSGNYSTITCTHKLICASSYSLYINSRSNTCVINGASKSFTSAAISTGGGVTITLGTTTHTVNHNSDGTGKFSITGTFNMQATIVSTYVGNIVTSGSATLNTILRASSISSLTSSVEVDGSNKVTVNISRNSSSFTHNVKFYINDSYKKEYTGVGTSQSYVIPTSWLAAMPSSTSCTAYCDVTTYNGGTKIGSTVKKSFTVKVPTTVVPTVGTITLTPASFTTKDGTSRSILVKNKNELTVKVSGSKAGAGSTIKSYTYSGQNVSSGAISGTSYTSASTINPTINGASTTLTYTVKVTDARGRYNSGPKTITCYNYSAPTFVSFDAYRVASSSDTTESDDGTYIYCSYAVKYYSVNSTNSRYSFAISGVTSSNITYNAWSTSTSSGVVTATGSAIIKSCATTSSYTLKATLVDNYGGTATSSSKTVFSEERILNIRKNGSGIAFGKIAGSDNVLDSKWQIRTDDAPNTMKNLTYKGSNIAVNDATADWTNQGNLATFFYNQADAIADQPAQRGFLLNIASGPGGKQVHQLWMEQAYGSLYHRGGSDSTLHGWRTVLDSTNCTEYVIAKPVELYSSSGTTGTCNLNYSAANFSYIEIFLYKDAASGYWSVKVPNPNNKKVQVGTQYVVNSSTLGLQLIGKTVTISEKTITQNDEFYMTFDRSTGAIKNIGGQTTIKIVKVLGYK